MTIKCTLLFELSTNITHPDSTAHRIAGWSESYYAPGTTVADALKIIIGAKGASAGLAPARAALLARGAAIVGVRFQVVAPAVGASQSLALSYPGNADQSTDVPQMALLCKAPGKNTANIRKFTLRGVPDLMVVEGEYSPTTGYSRALDSYFKALTFFQFRARDLTLPTVPIHDVAADGTITALGPLSLALLDQVRVLRTKDSGSRLRGGVFLVTATTATNVVRVASWPYGATTGGKVRKEAYAYPFIDGDSATPGRIIVHKVGRPFDQYRGRRSAIRH